MIKLLIIEDENKQKTMIEESIEAWNLEQQNETNKVNFDLRGDDSEIYKLLFYNKYDCIILDINWGTGREHGGSDLANRIIGNKRIPIFFYSGNISQVDDIVEQLGVKKFRRSGTAFADIIREVIKLKELKIFDWIGYEGEVDEKIRNIFWKDIKEIQSFLSGIPGHDDPDALTRIITTRIIESLSQNNDDKQKFFEFYIKPCLTTEPRNGDIYKQKETLNDGNEIVNYWLIITPSCQLRKVSNINLIKINPFSTQILEEIRKGDSIKKKENILRTKLQGDYIHFIPPLGDLFKMGVINFNEIKTLSKNSLNYEDKVVTINPTYMKDIQARFGQNFSKQGQPDIDLQHLINSTFL